MQLHAAGASVLVAVCVGGIATNSDSFTYNC